MKDFHRMLCYIRDIQSLITQHWSRQWLGTDSLNQKNDDKVLHCISNGTRLRGVETWDGTILVFIHNVPNMHPENRCEINGFLKLTERYLINILHLYLRGMC